MKTTDFNIICSGWRNRYGGLGIMNSSSEDQIADYIWNLLLNYKLTDEIRDNLANSLIRSYYMTDRIFNFYSSYSSTVLKDVILLQLLVNCQGLIYLSDNSAAKAYIEDRTKNRMIGLLYQDIYFIRDKYEVLRFNKEDGTELVDELVFPSVEDVQSDPSIIKGLIDSVIKIEKNIEATAKQMQGKEGKSGAGKTLSKLFGNCAWILLSFNKELLLPLNKTDQYCFVGDLIKTYAGDRFPKSWDKKNSQAKFTIVRDWLKSHNKQIII